jgi:[ribosomal protein S5]-alanine N-acetyltransferase
MTPIANTDRLLLRRITPSDAAFYSQLVNEPAWIANIGDRQVKSLVDAEQQITNKLIASYVQHGLGLYVVALTDTMQPIGICGLVKRDTLQHPDIGFAFLKAHWGQGYALESAQAVLRHAADELGLMRVLGITTPTNARSASLLLKLGLRFQGRVQAGGVSRDLYQMDVYRTSESAS